ncbi:MAG: class I SAM-dependent methyltransferase [Bacteroidota bacterium]|nr:class I SAM-dependent methyltransferase [Bacteroidota bacterium]
MKLGAERYSSKVEDYAKYRPDFPSEIINFLYANGTVGNSSVIADIGSGTGRFTRLLLEKGSLIYGIERNKEMRVKAEEMLSKFTNFISISGSAEETGLKSKSIDLITVAQAFHWFNREKCLIEFKRIIKDSGKVFIVWDDFIGNYNDFSIEQGKVISEYRAIKPENNGKRFTRAEMIDGFFKDNKFKTMFFTHELYEEFDEFKGGVLSASFTPKPGEEDYEHFITKLQEVFDSYQQNGRVCMAFRCECYLGEL